MRKSIFTIAFIFLGLNTLNAQDKPQAPALPVEAFKIENKISTTTKTYRLSKEQQQLLDSQVNSDKTTYTEAETLYTDLKKKYEL